MSYAVNTDNSERISTGIQGLDEILLGGLLPGHSYMLRGGPGTGKTTIGLQFLLEGAQNGEPVLFISLEESESQIRNTAKYLGFDISNVNCLDLSPTSEFFAQAQSYDIFSSAEVEREPLTQSIVEEVRHLKPKRVFLDPLTQFRYLSSDNFQFYRQILSFVRFLSEYQATLLITSESSPETPDYDVQFLVHSVIQLEQSDDLRTLSVIKYRNSDFITGLHTYRLTGAGAVVYPRLNPQEFNLKFDRAVLPIQIDEINNLLGGGIEKGTVNMISGPSGVGKTTLGMQIISSSVQRGEKAVVFSFEEEIEMILTRCDAVGIHTREYIENESLCVLKIEPLIYSADRFASLVRKMVEEQQIKMVMLDSTSGYNLAMKKGKLVDHLHTLCKYLQKTGVTIILITELASVTGEFKITENGISYLSDNVIFIRYLEMQGELKKAIGVLKKRLSDFEKTLREFEITGDGIKIGAPLKNLRGILRGDPEWVNK